MDETKLTEKDKKKMKRRCRLCGELFVVKKFHHAQRKCDECKHVRLDLKPKLTRLGRRSKYY